MAVIITSTTSRLKGRLIAGAFAVVIVVTVGCQEPPSPPANTGASGPTDSPSVPPANGSPVEAELASATESYRVVVSRYQELYAQPSRLRSAFRLLAPMERSFERWEVAVEVAIEDRTVQISAHALGTWRRSFRQWLANQALQRGAIARCSGGEPITELTLIGCLDVLGPIVHRDVRNAEDLNALLASEPSLAEILGDISF